MKKTFLIGWLLLSLSFFCAAQPLVVTRARQMEQDGLFKQAAVALKAGLNSTNYSAPEKKQIEFDLDRLDRIKKDYSFTREKLFSALKDSVQGLTREEFDAWIKEGWFDGRNIDGTDFYFNSGVANLYYRHPELEARRSHPKNNQAKEDLYMATITAIKKASATEKSPYVLPKTMRVDMEIIAKSGMAGEGETVKTWMPIPRDSAFQSDFKLLSTSSAPKNIAASDSPIRSLYLEQAARSNQATDFKVEYEYTIRGVHFDLHPEAIQPFDTNKAEYKKFTSEAPHVIFTPEMRALSEKIVGKETNSLLQAKKIFDWLADNLHYSFATEYSTIPNISDYCRTHAYGDCGQQALFFITLCRLNGIPARWQTGWNLFPLDLGIHDWAEIYLEPYGWMPVDPYMANYAMRYTTTLKAEQKKELRDFYFGGLDQYRMIANSDHNQTLTPPKATMRSDDVDFQRGELEVGNKNLYFDQYTYKLNYKVVSNPTLP